MVKYGIPSVRQDILTTANKAFIYTICEACDSTLAGNAPLTIPYVLRYSSERNIEKSLRVDRLQYRKSKGWIGV